MVALTWLRGPARPPPRPPARDRRRRRRRRRAAGLDRHLPVGDHVEDDRSARSPACRSTGRSRPSRGADPRGVLAQVAQPARASRARCRSASPTPPACSATHRRLDADAPGPARCSGCPTGYAQAFPGELRTLVRAAATGVLLAQQTAANLHATPGDTVTIGRRRRRPASVRVDGVVDLPAADSLFQQVGAPVGAQPQAPPDNVVLLPAAPFAPRSTRGAPGRRTQVHAPLAHRLPGSPSAAFTQVIGRRAQPRDAARRRRARRRQPRHGARPGAPGRALRRSCCSCSSACPGAVLAGAGHRVDRLRRRRPPAPRRGAAAHPRRLDAPARRGSRSAETALAGGARRRGRPRRRAADRRSRLRHRELRRRHARRRRCGPAAPRSPGCAIAAASIALPAWRDARALTVAGQRRQRRPPRPRAVVGALRPRLRRARPARRSSTGRRRATATSSCSRPRACRRSRSTGTRCSRPCSRWIGAGLLAYRLADLVLRRGRAPLARALRPLAGELVADRRGDDGPPAAAARQAPSRSSR